MKGLSSRFSLKDGAFHLTEGSDKVKDNVWFYCIFDKLRIYLPDFGANLVTLTQKPFSYLATNRTFFLGALQKGVQKYVGKAIVNDIDLGYIGNDRKNVRVKVDYTTITEGNSELQDVIFI